jgi:hypothetical protein
MMKYFDTFMSLRSSGDILNVVNPLGSRASKEITESMAMFSRLRKIALKAPMEYSLIDLCAGNALTSVLAAHVLPLKESIAVDKKLRKRGWESVRRFRYLNQDIFDDSIYELITDRTVICSVHPCSRLASRIVEIYLKSPAPYLVMMPCCEGQIKINGSFLRERLGRYACWCLQLAEQANGDLIQDNNCISPKNIVITAKKPIRYEVLDEDDGGID